MAVRFHVPAIPGQPTTLENSHCAYTQKVVKFARMMRDLGHEVIVYSEPDNDAPGEHVPCYVPSSATDFDPSAPHWVAANEAAIREINKRREDRDFLCLIAGRCQEAIARAFPDMIAVEFGIGYSGVFAPYRVYESYAWMHYVNGWYNGKEGTGGDAADGRNYDTVIPNYFDPAAFPPGKGDGGYLLYLGRMIFRKGIRIVEEIGKATELPVIYAGNAGDYPKPDYGDWIGAVGPEDRAKLLQGATALIAPTIYLEPFGGVAVEAMMCGTPAITSDYGAFPETVRQGLSGYRCHSLGEYVWAAEHAGELNRRAVREHAMRYSIHKIGPVYEAYFQHLLGLWGDGFMDPTPRRPLAQPE